MKTNLASVKFGLVPDWVDDSEESFEGQSHDTVCGRHQHSP